MNHSNGNVPTKPRPVATPADLRVLLVSWAYPPYMGGVQTHTREVAIRLARRGVDVTVLSTDPAGRLPVEEMVDGVRLKRVPAYPRQQDYYLSPAVYREITNQSDRWDVVHCQGYQTLVPPTAMLAAWRAGIPYTLTFHPGGHSDWLYKLIQRVQWQIIRPLLAQANRLVVTAKWEAQFFQKRMRLPANKFVLIPNGGTLPDLPPDEAQSPSNPEPLIVSIGRLEAYKGHQRVIAAMPHVLEQIPEARLRIVGEGPYEADLRAQVADLNLGQCVSIGAIPMTDRYGMARLLKQARLMTLLSEYEGHPMAVVEALAMGVPVLVSDHPGVKQFADDGFARWIPLHSTPVETGAAMIRQLQQPLYPNTFKLTTWDDCTNALLALYQTISRRSNPVAALSRDMK